MYWQFDLRIFPNQSVHFPDSNNPLIAIANALVLGWDIVYFTVLFVGINILLPITITFDLISWLLEILWGTLFPVYSGPRLCRLLSAGFDGCSDISLFPRPRPSVLLVLAQLHIMSIINAFPEENLSLTADEGFGFFPGCPGLTLNGCYEIVRKLGRGRFSSTWLVVNNGSSVAWCKDIRYLAVKILTADATRGHQRSELEYLKAIRDLGDDRPYIPMLRDDFEEEGPHGVHLCLVMDILSTDVIVALMVESLESLHDLNIIHTDLKLDNVLFPFPYNEANIEARLRIDGPAVIDGEFEISGKRYPIMRSQPLTHEFPWNASRHMKEQLNVYLTDFGHALKVDSVSPPLEISPYALRAPEVILGAKFDTKVDVWALGCITFELLTGHWLFDPQGCEEWSREDDHLAKMMELTGERFRTPLLERSRFRDTYFDAAGNLLRINDLIPVSIKDALTTYGVRDIEPTSQFIRDCLRFDPDERPSIKEIQSHAWLKYAFSCC